MEGNLPDSGNMAAGVEEELRELSEAMTRPRPHECLVCYVFRMMEYGCRGQQWMKRYRDLCAPLATALERRIARVGGFCDCEMLMNSFLPSPRYFETDEDGDVISQPMLACLGVRAGSTQPCRLWVGRREYQWGYRY